MKDKEFWLQKVSLVAQRLDRNDKKASLLRRKIATRSRVRRTSQNQQEINKLKSGLAYLERQKLYWKGRIGYFEERIRVLETRSRFDRILKSPVV